MNEKRDCMVDGREIEIISIEDILQKISRSIANLTDEQKNNYETQFIAIRV